MPCRISNLLAFALTLIVVCALSIRARAQAPSRLPIVTGVSGYQSYFHADSTIWMADGSIVYRNRPRDGSAWSHLPQLYRYTSAFITKATPTTVSVVARRLTPSDTSWWSFTADPTGEFWKDSLALDAVGSIIGSTPLYLLFSDTGRDTTMSIAVWRYDGTFATTMAMPTAYNTPYTTAKLCGDSIIVSDLARGVPVFDVIRNVNKDPATWTSKNLDDMVFGFVGEGNSFVFQKSGGVFIDHAGTVRPLGVFQDRLQTLYVDGLRAARIGNGALEITSDITGDSTNRVSVGVTLITSLDKVFTLRRSYAGVVRGQIGILELATSVLEVGVRRDRLVPFIEGTVTKGTQAIVSGDRVAIASGLTAPSKGLITPFIAELMPDPSGTSLVVSKQMLSSFGNTILKRVNGEVWAGISDGTFTFPDKGLVSNRTGYDAAGDNERAFLLTTRGIEIREGNDPAFRVFVDEQAPAGFALAGDTLVVIRIEDITTDVPEARWVVDAYDRVGNVMFYGALLVDSAVAKGLRFRSISMTPNGLLINGERTLYHSVNGGASWSSVSPGVFLATSLSVANDRVCAWGRHSDGTEGPCLMITPERWVMQPTVLRSSIPILACSSMPGWFVFSTGDGVWTVRQTISSIKEELHPQDAEGAPDETFIVDLLGRVHSPEENLLSGWYVVAQRIGQRVRSQIRTISR
ncbi:MAG: hypothetical protein NTX15_11705 [Candidatus Kapabacteria bacterium]|nr:hypothetical protein [Candidatus Kapabacteria bacterium]